MAARQFRFTQGRAEKRTRTGADVQETGMTGSVASMAGGVLDVTGEEYASAPAKRARSKAEEAKQAQKPVALRTVPYQVFATSNQGVFRSDDGSEFSLDISKAPPHLPANATNVYASLTSATIPYTWPNYENDNSTEVVRITTQSEKPIDLTPSSATASLLAATQPAAANYVRWTPGTLAEDFGSVEGTDVSLGVWRSEPESGTGTRYEILLPNPESRTGTYIPTLKKTVKGDLGVFVQSNGLYKNFNPVGDQVAGTNLGTPAMQFFHPGGDISVADRSRTFSATYVFSQRSAKNNQMFLHYDFNNSGEYLRDDRSAAAFSPPATDRFAQFTGELFLGEMSYPMNEQREFPSLLGAIDTILVLTLVYDASTGRREVWQNGVRLGLHTGAANATLVTSTNLNSDLWAQNGLNSYAFMQEITLYKTALSVEEIRYEQYRAMQLYDRKLPTYGRDLYLFMGQSNMNFRSYGMDEDIYDPRITGTAYVVQQGDVDANAVASDLQFSQGYQRYLMPLQSYWQSGYDSSFAMSTNNMYNHLDGYDGRTGGGRRQGTSVAFHIMKSIKEKTDAGEAENVHRTTFLSAEGGSGFRPSDANKNWLPSRVGDNNCLKQSMDAFNASDLAESSIWAIRSTKVFWVQGESDVNYTSDTPAQIASNYRTSMSSLLDYFQENLPNFSKLYFSDIAGYAGDDARYDLYYDNITAVNNEMYSLASQDSRFEVFATGNRERFVATPFYSTYLSDDIHYNQNAHEILGADAGTFLATTEGVFADDSAKKVSVYLTEPNGEVQRYAGGALYIPYLDHVQGRCSFLLSTDNQSDVVCSNLDEVLEWLDQTTSNGVKGTLTPLAGTVKLAYESASNFPSVRRLIDDTNFLKVSNALGDVLGAMRGNISMPSTGLGGFNDMNTNLIVCFTLDAAAWTTGGTLSAPIVEMVGTGEVSSGVRLTLLLRAEASDGKLQAVLRSYDGTLTSESTSVATLSSEDYLSKPMVLRLMGQTIESATTAGSYDHTIFVLDHASTTVLSEMSFTTTHPTPFEYYNDLYLGSGLTSLNAGGSIAVRFFQVNDAYDLTTVEGQVGVAYPTYEASYCTLDPTRVTPITGDDPQEFVRLRERQLELDLDLPQTLYSTITDYLVDAETRLNEKLRLETQVSHDLFAKLEKETRKDPTALTVQHVLSVALDAKVQDETTTVDFVAAKLSPKTNLIQSGMEMYDIAEVQDVGGVDVTRPVQRVLVSERNQCAFLFHTVAYDSSAWQMQTFTDDLSSLPSLVTKIDLRTMQVVPEFSRTLSAALAALTTSDSVHPNYTGTQSNLRLGMVGDVGLVFPEYEGTTKEFCFANFEVDATHTRTSDSATSANFPCGLAFSFDMDGNLANTKAVEESTQYISTVWSHDGKRAIATKVSPVSRQVTVKGLEALSYFAGSTPSISAGASSELNISNIGVGVTTGSTFLQSSGTGDDIGVVFTQYNDLDTTAGMFAYAFTLGNADPAVEDSTTYLGGTSASSILGVDNTHEVFPRVAKISETKFVVSLHNHTGGSAIVGQLYDLVTRAFTAISYTGSADATSVGVFGGDNNQLAFTLEGVSTVEIYDLQTGAWSSVDLGISLTGDELVWDVDSVRLRGAYDSLPEYMQQDTVIVGFDDRSSAVRAFVPQVVSVTDPYVTTADVPMNRPSRIGIDMSFVPYFVDTGRSVIVTEPYRLGPSYDEFNLFFDSPVPSALDPELESTNYDLVLPTGTYDKDSLNQALNLAMRLQHPEFKVDIDLFNFVEDKAQRKLVMGARVSSYDGNNLPHQVIMTYPSEATKPVTLAQILGWDLSSIVITDIYGTPYSNEADVPFTYTSPFASSYQFEFVNAIFLQTNFSQSGVNFVGEASRFLAKIPIDPKNNTPGDIIVYEPHIPLKVDAYQNLFGKNANELKFTLLDENLQPVKVGTSIPWTVNVQIEWEEEIDMSRIRQSKTETKFR